VKDHTQSFDDQIKANLERLHFTPEKGGFERMQASLAQEQDLAAIRDGLNAVHIPQRPEAFHILSQRLQQHYQLKRRILAGKILELAGLWLTILVVGGLPVKSDIESTPVPTSPQKEIVGIQAAQPSESTVAEVINRTVPSAGVNVPVTHEFKVSAYAKEKNALVFEQAPTSSTGTGQQDAPMTSYGINSDEEDSPVSPSNVTSGAEAMPDHGTEIQTLPPPQPGMLVNNILLDLPSKPFAWSREVAGAQLWGDFGTQYHRDLVKSPYPTQVSPQTLGRISGSMGVSAGLVFLWNRLDLATGVQYHYKSYESVYGGNNALHMLSIPVQARVKLRKIGNFQAYVSGGFATHYALFAHYSENSLFEQYPHLRYKDNNVKKHDISLLAMPSFESGILEGESYRGNQTHTLTIGIGAEYQLTPGLKIYLEQSYDHTIGRESFGPGFDQFFTTSIAVGVRTAILR
jgi:opacity protein-like surface antigen